MRLALEMKGLPRWKAELPVPVFERFTFRVGQCLLQ
jgi:hypothetical protein